MTTDTARRPRHVKVAGPVRHEAGTRRQRRLRFVVAGGAAVALVAGAGAASAAFRTMTTEGTGTATVRPPAPLALSSAEGAAGLAPGGRTTVTVSVHNPYARPLVVLGLTTAGPTTVVLGATAGCDPSVVSFAALVDPGAPEASVAPDSTATFTGTMTMSPDAPPQCQGVTFRIPVRVTARVS